MNMPKITIVLSFLLILLGAAGWIGTSFVSITALIPAFFGIVFLFLGLLGLKERARKHAMHIAAVLALIALFGSYRGLIKLPALLGGGELERPTAVAAQAIMAILSLIFIILAIKSFIDARRARKAKPERVG